MYTIHDKLQLAKSLRDGRHKPTETRPAGISPRISQATYPRLPFVFRSLYFRKVPLGNGPDSRLQQSEYPQRVGRETANRHF